MTYYELDLGLNHVVRKYSEPLDDMANMLITGNERIKDIEAEHIVLRTCDICKGILTVFCMYMCTCIHVLHIL